MDIPRFRRGHGPFRWNPNAAEKLFDARKLALAWRFLRRDTRHIYAYAYAPALPEESGPRAAGEPLPRSSPQAQGMRPRRIAAFFRALNEDSAAAVQAALVLRHGHVVAEGYWAPYEKDVPHQLYSISKSVAATAIGMLVDEGRLSLTEKLTDVFMDKVDHPLRHPMKDATVWHLLTMSTGARFDEIGSALGADWEREFFKYGTRFAPGTQFFYNSMNSYMLAALLRRKTGQTVMEYLRPRLFMPLGIESAAWERCPAGTEKGGWGLSLTLEDAAKIGLLYLRKGVWTVNGKERQILSRGFIEEATRKQIATPGGAGYGYQIWVASARGEYCFNGAFGQYLLMSPGEDGLVAVFSGSSRLFAQKETTRLMDALFHGAADGAFVENAARRGEPWRPAEPLTRAKERGLIEKAARPASMEALARRLHGRAYAFPENAAGLLPVVLQTCRNNFSAGVQRISFEDAGGVLSVAWEEGGQTTVLRAEEGAFTRSAALFRGDGYILRVGARSGVTEKNAAVLRLCLYFIETPSVRIVTLTPSPQKLRVTLDETPGVNDAAGMLLELSGVTRWEFFRALMPLLKREKLQTRFRELAVTHAEGKRVGAD